MAFLILTNPKTILSLGPNRSILGTIIRPDPDLLERKGGCNGDVTFNSLLPGAGELIQPYYDHHAILGNWQLGDEEKELPRGGGIAGDAGVPSIGKKRKSSSKGKSSKSKRNGEAGKVSHEETGSGKEREKLHWRNNRNAVNGFSNNVGGSPLSR